MNPARFYQPINFSGIRLGNILPSDIDLICECGSKFTVEFHNKAWIFLELKYRNAEFTLGQKLTYERLVDDITKTGKRAISFIAEHTVDDPTQEINAAECTIRKFYWKGKWRDCDKKIKLQDAIRSFVSKL